MCSLLDTVYHMTSAGSWCPAPTSRGSSWRPASSTLMYPAGVENVAFFFVFLIVPLRKNASCMRWRSLHVSSSFSLQITEAQGFSQENGTAEALGMVYWPHPDDLTAMEDCDRSTGETWSRGAKRWVTTVRKKPGLSPKRKKPQWGNRWCLFVTRYQFVCFTLLWIKHHVDSGTNTDKYRWVIIHQETSVVRCSSCPILLIRLAFHALISIVQK